jgi:hypothetical protein
MPETETEMLIVLVPMPGRRTPSTADRRAAGLVGGIALLLLGRVCPSLRSMPEYAAGLAAAADFLRGVSHA